MTLNNAEFDALVAMVWDGRLSRTEFLLKMQLHPDVVGHILTLHKLPAAVTRNIEIGDLMLTDDQTWEAASEVAPKKRPIPEGVTWEECTGSFRDSRGVLSADLHRAWVDRKSEFPAFKEQN